MKKSNRALAVLLSLVITLSYMPAMAFAGTEDGTDPGSNTATETGQEVENEDLTSNTEGDTGNDVEESNVQEEQAESNTPTANQQEPEEEPVLLGTESDNTEPVEEYVASIGDAKYSTVADALAAAKAGDKITLLKDVTENITVASGKEVVLDLNGHSLTNANGKHTVFVYGSLTVKDSSEGGKIASTNNCGLCVSGGTLVFESGVVEAQEMAALVMSKGKATINGGTFIAKDNAVLGTNGSAGKGGSDITVNGGTFNGNIQTAGYVACGIYAPNDDTWTLNGGTFNITNGAGIVARAGEINIPANSKVQFNTTGNATGKVGDSRVVVPCSAIVFDSQAAYPGLTEESTLAVAGGTFKSEAVAVTAVTADGAADKTYVAVSGGSYSSEVPESCCAEGFAPSTEKDEDGMYVIVDDHAASIGNTKYVTLAEALNAANSGDTLTLLKDVTENIKIASDKKVTFDLNGHSLTNAGKGHTVTVEGSLTVKDSAEGGKIVSTSDCGICVSGGKLIFNSGAVEAQEMAILFIDAGFGAINSGTFTAKDNAVLGTNGSTGRGGNVINVNGGTFNGNIQTAGYVACGIYAPNDDTWNLNGGTFNITGGAGIVARAGKINIPAESKVQFNTTGNATGKVGDSRVVVPCSAIVFDSQAAYPGLTDKATIAVAGGTFKSEAAAVTAITADGAADKTYVAVSGGSYSSEVPESCCDYGFVPIKQDDGSYSVKKTDVAVIGDKTYPTLAEAVEAASDGDTIKMIADEKLRASVTVDKTLTLDLNGKKVFYDTESHLHKVLTIKGKDKTVTVTDTSEGKTGELNATASPTGSQDRCVEVVEGTFVVEGGTIAGPLFGIYNDRGGTTKINGGTVTGEVTIKSHGSLEMTGGSMKAKSTAISLWPGSTTKITGGILDCDEVGIELYKANEEGFSTLDITDCELVTRWTTTNASTIISRGGNKITISGGSFTCKRSHSGRDTDMSFCTGDAVSISGGKFSLFAVYESQQPDLTITGGYFQNDISTYVKEPYRCVSDSTYERYPYKVCKYVASIQTESTETYYETLEEAVAAAVAGDTIRLLADVELKATQNIDKNLVIDLNDNNIAATDARALYIKSGNVEIKGSGTISATGEGLAETSSVIRVGDSATNTNKAKLTVGKNVTVSTDKSYGITVFGKNLNPISLELKGKVNVTGNSSAISGNGSAGLSPTSILIAEGAEVTSANEYAIYHPEDGTLTVNGKVEGKGGIEIKSGKLIVGDSANITANGEPKYSGVNNNGPSTSGYAIASVGNGGYANVPAVEVQGGSIAGTVTSVLENNAEKSGEVTATSDQISVPEGYAWKEENGHYVLKTPLDFEKEAANKELDKVDIEQYSYDDLTKIRAAIEKARADVEAAKTVEDVEVALATFNEAKAECKTNAEKLAEAKSAANKQLDEYKPADYSGDDKTAVESAIAAAKTAIEGAKTIEAVDAAVAEAKAAIAACTTDAQKLDNAKANANAQLDAVDKSGLSDADITKVNEAITTAKTAISEAKTVDAVNEALTTANNAIAGIKSDASKLAGAKELAKEQLDAIDTEQYSDDELAAVKKAIADAKAAIDEATTVAAVNKALTDANSTIAEQKTDVQKAADALQSAKDAANAELNAIDTSNYSGDELEAVKDAIAAARTAIEAAKNVDAVTTAKSAALDTVSKQKTNTQKEAEKLAAAKDAALTELGKIDTTKYSGDDLKEVEKAIADARTAIEAAETVDAVNAAVKTAEDAVAGQKTDEQKSAEALQKAKDDALAELDKIDLANYSGDDLKTMSAEIKKAKAAINAAENLDAVSSAKTTFETATKDCKTDEEKAEEATEENADKKLKEAEEAAKAAQTAAETAEASKTAAEAAAKTPGQAAVDAAQKALDDANAAKQAADEAKAKAEAAKTAAEAAYGADSDQAKEAQNLVDNATTAANNAATAVTNAQSAVTNAKNAKAAADRAAAANKEIQDLPVVKITKPKAKKKKAVVRWKKVSKKNKKKIQGIQIQVATDPGFKNIVKNTTAKKTKKSKTIKGLKSKTTYWVRIRAYKNVGSVRHVSAWKVKKVKVK